MATDKSWTKIRNRAKNQEFRNGLREFIYRCRPFVDRTGLIKCPCNNCLNADSYTLETVEKHIILHGFSENYDVWIHHGEQLPREDTGSSNMDFQSMDEMVNVMEDLDPHELGVEGPDEQYDRLYEAMRTELYHGISSFSSLNFLVKLMNIKVQNKWTNRSFDQLLKLLKLAFPDMNLVTSHYEAKKLMANLGLGYQNIHVCKYDCALYWKENADRETCPVCNESRWTENSRKRSGSKVPHKVLRYFSITPRLKRLYATEETARLMRWHSLGQDTRTDVMTHPRDGGAWHSFDARHPHFSSERRNVRLGLAADGFNPFGDMSQAYSMWPVILTVYNLPPWLCMKPEYLMLALLIPGPKSPGKDMDVFLRPLVDELKELWSVGVDTRDAATSNRGLFRMRTALIWTINDFPARSSLSGWSGQGYMACPTCNEETPSVQVLGKTAYIGHRRWLPANHRFRGMRDFNGHIERRGPPIRKSAIDILQQLSRVRPTVTGKHPDYGGVRRRRHADELNWRKRSIFFELPYWSSNDLQHNIDMMHVDKNVCDSLMGTILEDQSKTKDTPNARRDLMKMGIRPELHLYHAGGKLMKPRASYTLARTNRVKFCNFIRSVRFPDGFASNLKRCVPLNEGRITGLKSHDCHVIMQRLLPAASRAFLNKEISDAIIELSNFFTQMSAKSLNKSDLIAAQPKVILILCKLERIFPPAFFNVMIHVVMHLPEEAILGGPEQLRWMFPIERYLKHLKEYVGNQAKPEGSIAEGYVAEEALTFCARYFTDVDTRFNRPLRNPVCTPTTHFSVFQSQCFPIGARKAVILEPDKRRQALFYILNNCPEIQTYMQEHKHELTMHGCRNVVAEHRRRFHEWFYKKIYYMRQANPNSVSPEMYAVASGFDTIAQSVTACTVNGVRFLAHERDTRRQTQNSGVSVCGSGGEIYYGVLHDILDFQFMGARSVVLFRCKWFKCDQRRIIHDQYITSIDISLEGYKDDQFILATQAKQVFYTDDPSRGANWRVVHEVHHSVDKDGLADIITEIDLLHPDNSSRFSLFVDLGNLEHVELQQDGMEADEVVETPRPASATLAPDASFCDDDDLEDDTIEEYEDVEQVGIGVDEDEAGCENLTEHDSDSE